MLERGVRYPSLDTVFAISEALQIKTSELLAQVEFSAIYRNGIGPRVVK